MQKRFALFLFGCIPTRLLLAYTASQLSTDNLKILGYICLLPAIGFLYIYLTGSRDTGLETGGEKIWWNNLRPLHSFNYFLFSYLAINGYVDDAWKILLFDVIFGLLSFLYFHSQNNDFELLF